MRDIVKAALSRLFHRLSRRTTQRSAASLDVRLDKVISMTQRAIERVNIDFRIFGNIRIMAVSNILF